VFFDEQEKLGFFRYPTHYIYWAYERQSECMSQENGDHEEREVEFEHLLPREEIVEYLQAFTDGLEGGETITLSAGDESVEFAPPEYLGFEVEYEEEGNEREVELEFEWTVQEDELNIDSE